MSQETANDTAIDAEIARLDYENWRTEYIERLGHQVQFAHAAIRGATLVNGGAIIALFTFIGNSKALFDRTGIWWAFGAFGSGLFLALLTSLFAFLSVGNYLGSTQQQLWNAQLEMLNRPARYDADSTWKIADRWQLVGILALVLSLLAFGSGSIFALNAVMNPPKAAQPPQLRASALLGSDQSPASKQNPVIPAADRGVQPGPWEKYASIPAAFLGEWNERLADCGTGNNDTRLRIEPKRIRYYESDAEVRRVVIHNSRAVTVEASFAGEGETWNDTVQMVLSRSGADLTTGDLTRHRCR